ncbi:MAG TPA: AAA family ATPase, partial [Actinomycetota bacterium]|nr:AAA family ATPase [Actinomycetota bacterium]
MIAIANQKGGVGKSTTAVSLGAALAEIGYRVLVADLDPQGNASTGLGIRHEARDITVYDVVVAEADIHRAIVPTPLPRLHAVPATIDLAGAEIELVSQFSRETRLKKAIEPVSEGVYDFILLDCPPSLGLLTINALTAAEELIVPIQCEYYALEGLGQLLRNVSLVQQNINAGLRLSGIVMTMFDPRTKLSEQVVAEVQRYFGDLVYSVIIPRTVRLSEAPGFGQPITAYDARSRGAVAYRELAREVAMRPPPETPMPSFDDLAVAVSIEDMAPALVDHKEEAESPAEVSGQAEPQGAEAGPEASRTVEEPSEVAMEPPGAVASPDASTDAATQSPPSVDTEDAFEEPPPAEPEPASAPPPERDERPPSRRPPAPAPQPAAGGEDLWVEPQPEPEPRVKRPSRPAPPGELPERRVVVIDDDPDVDIRAGQEAPPPPPGSDEERPGMAEIGATLEEDAGR